MKNSFIAIDIETTGLFPHRGSRIIELGAVKVKDMIISDEFSCLLWFVKKLPSKIVSLTGITDQMISNEGVDPRIAFHGFEKFIDDESLIVAHSSDFENRFLKYEYSRLGMQYNHKIMCSLQLSRAKLSKLPNYKLSTVYKKLFNKELSSHRALNDARAVADIWIKMSY